MELRRVKLPSGEEFSDLAVERVGEKLYRLNEHPLLTNWCGLHDIVECEEDPQGGLLISRVVAAGPWRTLLFGINMELAESSALVDELEKLKARGGHWDRAFGGMLWVHLPRGRYRSVGRPFVQWFRNHWRSRPAK